MALTRFEAEVDADREAERRAAIHEATSATPGWLGVMVFRSTTEPRQMLRLTLWESLEARERLHASEAGRALGLGTGPPREFYELVYEDRPAANG